jgi:hypothetical protein
MGNWSRWILSIVLYRQKGLGRDHGFGGPGVRKARWIVDVSSGKGYEAFCTDILCAEALNGGNQICFVGYELFVMSSWLQ